MTQDTFLASSIRYVDVHCHIDLYPDPVAFMREAEKERVGVVAVTNTPSVFEPLARLAAPFPNIAVALGLHPELAEDREAELRLVPRLIGKTHIVGEIGLDGTGRRPQSMAVQQRVFRAMIDRANTPVPRVLTVHTRRAVRAAFSALADASGPVILHWFTGTAVQAKEAVERGWWFSVNPVMLRSGRGRSLLASIPPRLMLTESDGPFAKVEGRPCRPEDVCSVVDHLASLWKTDHEEAREQVMENARRCFATWKIEKRPLDQGSFR